MKKAKTILAITGVFIILFIGNMTGISSPQQTTSKSAQTKTKAAPAKSAQTKKKTTQTKSAATKSKPVQPVSKSEPEKKKDPSIVTIGNQNWSIANLNVNIFRNGDTIPEAKSFKEWVAAGESGKPAWCYYNNDPKIGLKYGKLYNWFAVTDPRGLAPAGWSLPGDADWAKLINYLGGQGAAGNKIKSLSGWNEGSNGSNETGFNGFPGGYRIENGTFQNIGSIGIWWSITENNPLSAFDHYLSQSSIISRSNSPKQRGESVRCIKE